MKQTLALLVVLALAVVATEGARNRRHGVSLDWDTMSSSSSSKDHKAAFQWFTQLNNHFDKSDRSTWQQRYQINATFWGGAGYPIFLVLGGEGPMSTRELNGAFEVNNWASQTKALLVAVEHRFYGESIPGDGTLSVKNLGLLNADQALADYALFISTLRKQLKAEKSPIVTFGGSYSGSLSAWMRQKYPSVVFAAIASSAPVRAQMDFPEYMMVVRDSVGPKCAAAIKQAMDRVDTLLNTEDGRKVLDKEYHTCTPISSDKLDMLAFLDSLSAVAGVVQYSGDNNRLGQYDIKRMCDIILSDDPAVSYPKFILDNLVWSGGNCTGASYADELADLLNEDPSAPGASGRSWVWQTCVEYGYYQTCEYDDLPCNKRSNLDYSLRMCNDGYGFGNPLMSVSQAVDNTNSYYGGRSISSSRIFLLNGSLDPWHALGVTSSQDPNMPAVYIQGTAHCADLYASRPTDLPSLTAARQASFNQLKQWLAQGN